MSTWNEKDERHYEQIKQSAHTRGRNEQEAHDLASETIDQNRREEVRSDQLREDRLRTDPPETKPPLRHPSVTEEAGSHSAAGDAASSEGLQTGSAEPATSDKPLEQHSVDELRRRAAQLNIVGRSRMKKMDLIDEIRKRQQSTGE